MRTIQYNHKLIIILHNYIHRHNDSERIISELEKLQDVIREREGNADYVLHFKEEGGTVLWNIQNIKTSMDYPKQKEFFHEIVGGFIEIQ